MNPSKEEVDELIRQCEADGTFYHDLRNHNRAIAKQRIASYHERKFYAPNHAQMSGAVRGGDRYDFHRQSFLTRFLRWLKNWSDQL